ncbi:LutC/YkgG family protein [Desulfogranum marinum]|uniref:LutC/YkgG family protein n=1 Tax=Desulfogranum marinum TaxID=453220 RepID=UPI001962B7DC|nr:lactate utilization protein C [Desulfogranum marinum]MBM9513332.1 lactate utilization protein C [Desulfogranum marinum]
MMHTNKKNFLLTVSRALGREAIADNPTSIDLPQAVQEEYYQNTTAQELKDLFIEQSRTAGTIVHECALASLNDTILTVASELGEGPILIGDEPLLHEQQTAAALSDKYTHVHMWDCARGRENNIDTAESAGIGITVAQFALAETGTVMVHSHKGCGRAVTLLPTTTIFIIKETTILPRLTQGMAWLAEQSQDGLPASVNYISGASSTADIELVRVQGVHGPIKIAYIIVTS